LVSFSGGQHLSRHLTQEGVGLVMTLQGSTLPVAFTGKALLSLLAFLTGRVNAYGVPFTKIEK
jgi:hypothetical protein